MLGCLAPFLSRLSGSFASLGAASLDWILHKFVLHSTAWNYPNVGIGVEHSRP